MIENTEVLGMWYNVTCADCIYSKYRCTFKDGRRVCECTNPTKGPRDRFMDMKRGCNGYGIAQGSVRYV